MRQSETRLEILNAKHEIPAEEACRKLCILERDPRTPPRTTAGVTRKNFGKMLTHRSNAHARTSEQSRNIAENELPDPSASRRIDTSAPISETPMIKATFTITKDDVLVLTRHYYSSSPTVLTSRRWGRAAPPISLLVIAMAMISHEKPMDITPAIPLVILAAAWAIFYPRIHSSYLLYYAEKMYNESAYQKTFGPCTIIAAEDGIHSTSAMGETRYSWSGVNSVLLTTTHLLIFLAGPLGFSIPRNQVPETTIQDLKSLSDRMLQNCTQTSSSQPANPTT